ncbi:MAG: hypothetical protein ACUVRS_12760, partial [Armatimonadota bacterium]
VKDAVVIALWDCHQHVSSAEHTDEKCGNIRQDGLRPSLAQPFVFQKVVSNAEHADEKCGNIYG